MFDKLRLLVSNRSRRTKIVLVAAALPVVVVLLAGLVFAADRFLHRGEVLRNVTLEGESIAGLSEERLRLAIAEKEDELLTTPALFTVGDREFVIEGSSVAFAVDHDAVVAEAMTIGRQGGPVRQFRSWWNQFGEETTIDLPTGLSESALDDLFDQWEIEAIPDPVFDGAVEIVDGLAVANYPREGMLIDRDAAKPLVLATFSTLERPPTEIPLELVSPRFEAADLDAAVDEANLLIESPVVLSRFASTDELRAEFSSAQLANSFRSEVVEGPSPSIELYFDPVTVDLFLEPLRAQLELPPKDAEFLVNPNDTVTLIPGHSGTLVEPDAVAGALLAAARSATRRGTLPILEGAQPEFTTLEAQAMMPMVLESEFTTNHSCCQNRVANIQLFADMVDGAIVQPGDTFSLNEHVGQRTADKGFKFAPMIRQGVLEDVIGGGVSQFATTFFNAVFFGAYEDVEHTPHSIYISRYPECNEATISWPEPNLIFRNNTEAILIIKTEYTDTSITVKFFGNNGGAEVERSLGPRSGFTEPVMRYTPNPLIIPGTENVITGGSRGWSVSCSRTITYPDGTEIKEDFTHRYRGEVREVEVHPCDIPESTDECPAPVPPLGGLTFESAQAAAAAVGLVVVRGPDVSVTIESGLDGLVAIQSPTDGMLLPLGSAITVNIGVAPPSPTTTTTTVPATTTTTAAP